MRVRISHSTVGSWTQRDGFWFTFASASRKFLPRFNEAVDFFFFFLQFLVTLWVLSQKSQDSRWNTLNRVLCEVNGLSHELDTGVRSVILPVTCHNCCCIYFNIFSSSNSTAFIEIYVFGDVWNLIELLLCFPWIIISIYNLFL